ncbi:argininosuccinate lyase [Clostridia bacterium OttesenSCG-928-F22]|nr:argininosuccinate lyase [Clostridia bacterium OttesenSCG-928-F22]
MKLWGGRFEKNTTKQMDDFHSSIHFDCRLYREDILGSIAHANMLGAQKIIPQEDAKKIVDGLRDILADIEKGNIEFEVSAEDIHMNIEKLLIERIGEAGKKLHTGRSRNDQVALDMRMYAKKCILETTHGLTHLLEALLTIAEKHIDAPMPGYTHLQKAQPITLGHHAMAYFQMFYRDCTRLMDAYKRTDVMPLGAGALAGTVYPIDRDMVKNELGFAQITLNSLDAVSDRDFCIEYASCASIIMMHLSRYCEELILWCTNEFGFIEMDDAYATGSSIMPQKKNPDVAELVRGKTGRVYGSLMALLAAMKGLPLAYNKDMQEDKQAFFDVHDTVTSCIGIFTSMLSTATFHTEVMQKGALDGFTNATDLADYLVEKGLPFRSAHEVSGNLVLHCIKNGKTLLELSLDELKEFSPLFEEDIYQAISLSSCIGRRNVPGGTSPEAVAATIAASRVMLQEIQKFLS